MTIRRLATMLLCAASLSQLAVPAVLAGPNGHANDHAQSNGGSNGNGNGGGNGNGDGSESHKKAEGAGAPHAVVRQYVLANGLKQGDVASTLKSWNSLNANPKAFLNNLNNPNSLLGKEAQYICDNAGSQADLTSFIALGGDPANPPTAQNASDAQAFLDAQVILGGLDPATVASDPNSYTPDQVTAANLVLNSSFDTTSAQAAVDQYDAWTAYQATAQKASASFAAASVSYRGSTDLSKVRAAVDGVVAQKGLDASSLCTASTASAL
jgi:hypothetical protein